MKNVRLLHPFLFTLTSILYMYLTTSLIASPGQMIRPLLVFWGTLLLLAFPAYWLTKDWSWTSILLSVIAISFFSSPDIFKGEIVFSGVVLVCAFIYLRIRKKTMRMFHVDNVLTLASGLLALIFVGILSGYASGISLFDMPQFTWGNRSVPSYISSSDEMPDIYYIVLDGYGRADVLDEYYKYDNSGFIESLRTKGFIVPDQARSNYPKTMLSIPSTLNMDYISNLTPELQGKDTHFWWLLSPLVKNSDVRQILEGMGYRSYSTTTGWGPTDNSTTDVYYQPEPVVLNDFEFVVLSVSPMRMLTPFLDKFSYVPSFDDHRNLMLNNFSSISAASKDDGPKFVFSHIVLPHPPFVFDENGEPLTPNYSYTFNDANDAKLTEEEYRTGYVNQLKFVNKRVEQLVDDILANSKTPPIIIIQGDHGPGMMTDFASSENTCLKERFSIFAAYYFPGVDASIVPEDITPVNLFRIVFNQYFGADYDMLPRHHYFVEDSIYLFRTEEVTDRVDTCR